MNHTTATYSTPPVSGWSGKPIDRAELLARIDSAIERITHGEGTMRVPAENTDPDLVLADCKRLLQAPPLPKDPPPGLLMSMAMRYDHALAMRGFYDQFERLGIGHGITHAQRLDGTLRQMRQIYEEVSGHGFYSPAKEDDYARTAREGLRDEVLLRDLTQTDLQQEVRADAARLIDKAKEYGLIVTIEHRRTPDAKPAHYVIDVRATRAVYDATQSSEGRHG